MIEYVPIPAIIIGSLLFAYYKKSYVSQILVVANFLVFIYYFINLNLDPGTGGTAWKLVDTFAFVPARMGQPGSLMALFTSMFMHAGPLHLIGNVLILYLLGLPLEDRIGSRNFAIIYFLTGIAATLSFYLMHTDSDNYLVGASGAIFGIGGALLILYPKDRIPMLIGPFFTTRAPVWLAVGTMFAIETILVYLSFEDGVAHIAHVGGVVCGVIIAPMIVQERSKPVNIDFEVLRTMVSAPEDHLIIDKIQNEGEKDVREAWLDFFFQEVARCPKCKRRVQRASEISCECGTKTKIMK